MRSQAIFFLLSASSVLAQSEDANPSFAVNANFGQVVANRRAKPFVCIKHFRPFS